MSGHRIRFELLAVILLALSALPAFAAGARIVRLSYINGDVQIDRNAGEGLEKAITNMPVPTGTRLVAANDARAEVEFEDGSTVRLAGPAEVVFQDLSLNRDGSRVNAVQVVSGVVYVNARLKNHEDFRLTGPAGENFALTKSSRLRLAVDEQGGSLSVFKGEALIMSGNPERKVKSAQTYNFAVGTTQGAEIADKIEPLAPDGWDRERDKYIEQYARNGYQHSYSSDPYAYGVSDLGYYGGYTYFPGYGYMWRPAGFDIGWDPFAYGAWSFYPAFGWTFVSGYPWGWAPYYYGNWTYMGAGYGWYWRPGRWNGWSGYPRWTNAPNGWNPPRPPSRITGTVAVPGSGLVVGPAAGRTVVHGVTGTFGQQNVGVAGGPVRRGVPAPGVTPRVGFAPANPRPGVEVHRPPAGFSPRVADRVETRPGAPGQAVHGTAATPGAQAPSVSPRSMGAAPSAPRVAPSAPAPRATPSAAPPAAPPRSMPSAPSAPRGGGMSAPSGGGGMRGGGMGPAMGGGGGHAGGGGVHR